MAGKFDLGSKIGAIADRELARRNPTLATLLTTTTSNFSNPQKKGETMSKQSPAPREQDDDESYVFSLESAERNLEYAAAAWRLFGCADDIIVQDEKTGLAMVGSEEACEEYFETHQLDNNWTEWAELEDILSLDYDQTTIRSLLNSVDPVKLKKARQQFEGWNWEKQKTTTEFKSIKGIDTSEFSPTFLGIAKEIVYASKKDGQMQEYIHTFAEDSGKPVSLYAIGDNTLAIHGGGMHIEDRGIID